MRTTILTRDDHPHETTATALPAPATVPVTALTTTLRGTRNHGDLQPLAAHIAACGLRNPVTLNPAGQVITGERRVMAASLAGLALIPARTITTVQQALDVALTEREADQADPDAAALVVLPDILSLIELDAAIRTLQWWPRGSGVGSSDVHRRLLTRVADNLDGTPFWNSSHYTHGRVLWLAAQGYRSNSGNGQAIPLPARDQELAVRALTELRHRDTTRLTAVHGRWRQQMPPAARRKTARDAPSFTSKDVPGILASLRGTTGAVTRTGVPGSDLTANDRAQLDDAITKLLNQLTLLRKGIRQ